MKLTEFISKKAIVPVLKASDKKGVIQELVQAARKAYDGERFVVTEIVDAIVQREKIGSTGIGGGVGVPHAKLDGIKNVIGAFGRCAPAIDFNAVDGGKVDLVFLILSPPSKGEAYLKALQKVMTALKRPNFVKFLKAAKTVRDIDDIFREVEEVAV
ncbi:MAG: PTS sugar transporter subunit IIA [Planctomycetaceae bacterium]|nr:PTS sugar transporter subunit IIA [Planctomycetaceae bacterium]